MKKTFRLKLHPISSESEIYFRILLERDKEKVLALLRENWPADRSFDRSLFERMERTFVITLWDEAIATASAGFSPAHLPHIHWVVVHSDYRRLGIASFLVKKVIEFWEFRGFKEVYVSTNPSTEENQKFYESLGFREWECDQV